MIEWRLARETEVPSRDGESEKIELRQLETGQGGGVCVSGKREKKTESGGSESGRCERTEPCDTTKKLMKMRCLRPPLQ